MMSLLSKSQHLNMEGGYDRWRIKKLFYFKSVSCFPSVCMGVLFEANLALRCLLLSSPLRLPSCFHSCTWPVPPPLQPVMSCMCFRHVCKFRSVSVRASRKTLKEQTIKKRTHARRQTALGQSHRATHARKGVQTKGGGWSHPHTWHSEAPTPCCRCGTRSVVNLLCLTMWHATFVILPSVHPPHVPLPPPSATHRALLTSAPSGTVSQEWWQSRMLGSVFSRRTLCASRTHARRIFVSNVWICDCVCITRVTRVAMRRQGTPSVMGCLECSTCQLP